MSSISTIKLKRCFNYRGNFNQAKEALKKINPPLEVGEPIIVGYYSNPDNYTSNPTVEQGPDKFFLAIGRILGVSISSPIIIPLFDDKNDQIDSEGNITIKDVESKYEEAVEKYFSSEKGKELIQKYITNDASEIVNVVANVDEVSEDIKRAFEEATGKSLDDESVNQQELNEFILNNLNSGTKLVWEYTE